MSDQPELKPKRYFAVSSPTGVHIGLWEDGEIAADVRAETDGNTIIELIEANAAPAVTVRPLEAVKDALAGALGDAYDCTRVWEAWSYGTMGPDDFTEIACDDERLTEISDAILSALSPQPPVTKEQAARVLLADPEIVQNLAMGGLDGGTYGISQVLEHIAGGGHE